MVLNTSLQHLILKFGLDGVPGGFPSVARAWPIEYAKMAKRRTIINFFILVCCEGRYVRLGSGFVVFTIYFVLLVGCFGVQKRGMKARAFKGHGAITHSSSQERCSSQSVLCERQIWPLVDSHQLRARDVTTYFSSLFLQSLAPQRFVSGWWHHPSHTSGVETRSGTNVETVNTTEQFASGIYDKTRAFCRANCIRVGISCSNLWKSEKTTNDKQTRTNPQVNGDDNMSTLSTLDRNKQQHQ